MNTLLADTHSRQTDPPPVADDLSAFVIAGQVSSDPSRFDRELDARAAELLV